MESLEELRVLLEDMTPEERLAKISQIREDRKVSKHAVTVRAKRSKDKKDKLKDRFKAMSPEEQAEFLRLMGVGDEG